MKLSISNIRLVLALGLCASVVVFSAPALGKQPPRVQTWLENTDEDVEVLREPDGTYRFRLLTTNGTEELTPDQFAERVHTQQSHRDWWMLIFNITSPLGLAWVGLGLGGQVMFTGRMVLTLFSREKTRASIVPISFWWMSLIGASMLMVYFLWRKDIVGVLGQSIGWVVYIRNLHLIYSARREASPVAENHGEAPQNSVTDRA